MTNAGIQVLSAFLKGRTNNDWTISGGQKSTCRRLYIRFLDHEVTKKSSDLQ